MGMGAVEVVLIGQDEKERNAEKVVLSRVQYHGTLCLEEKVPGRVRLHAEEQGGKARDLLIVGTGRIHPSRRTYINNPITT